MTSQPVNAVLVRFYLTFVFLREELCTWINSQMASLHLSSHPSLHWRPRPHSKSVSATARDALVLDFCVNWRSGVGGGAAGENSLEAFCICRLFATNFHIGLN